MDYKKAYYFLFNEITKTIEILQKAQIEAEDICIRENEDNIKVIINEHYNIED